MKNNRGWDGLKNCCPEIWIDKTLFIKTDLTDEPSNEEQN